MALSDAWAVGYSVDSAFSLVSADTKLPKSLGFSVLLELLGFITRTAAARGPSERATPPTNGNVESLRGIQETESLGNWSSCFGYQPPSPI